MVYLFRIQNLINTIVLKVNLKVNLEYKIGAGKQDIVNKTLIIDQIEEICHYRHLLTHLLLLP